MKTVNYSIAVGETNQVADGTMVTTVQVLDGFLRMYVGDAAPTDDSNYVLLTRGDIMPMAQNVKAWVKGRAEYSVASVEPVS